MYDQELISLSVSSDSLNASAPIYYSSSISCFITTLSLFFELLFYKYLSNAPTANIIITPSSTIIIEK